MAWWRLAAIGIASLVLGAGIVVPKVHDALDTCEDYTTMSWHAPGSWQAAVAHADRLLGARHVEDNDRLAWAQNPLAPRLAAWSVKDLAWELPSGLRLGIDLEESKVSAWLSGSAVGQADLAALLAAIDPLGSASWNVDGATATGPGLDLDGFIASWGAPVSGLQLPLGSLFILVSEDHHLSWTGERGTLEVALQLDLVPLESPHVILLVDGADRVEVVLLGHADRLWAARAAADAVAPFGIAPPGAESWSVRGSCHGGTKSGPILWDSRHGELPN